MKDIGVRELKIHASKIVREVAERHAIHTTTRLCCGYPRAT
jgi:antitoxin (DNA-binding transcriptional repressor) of toxin-antitoxin stability system